MKRISAHSSACIARAVRTCLGLSGMITLVTVLWPNVASAAYLDKAGWITNASNQILTNFTQIDAFLWFNMNKERDWRVDSSASSLAAYRAAWGTLQQGVFLDGFPYPSPPDTTKVDAFETLVGSHQTRVGWYESLDMPFPTNAVAAVQARSSIPYIVWEPFDGSVAGETARTGESRLDDIVAGQYDVRITQWAQAAAALGGEIDITFGHEMNGNWFTWGYLADGDGNSHNGNSTALFINAYRHVVDIFRANGATNVKWVWTINASWEDDFTAAYPGDDYVDRMGMNGFNWGDDPNGSGPDYAKWREFEQIFGAWDPNNPNGVNNYLALTQLSSDPIIIGEFASAPEPISLMLLAIGGTALLRRRR